MGELDEWWFSEEQKQNARDRAEQEARIRWYNSQTQINHQYIEEGGEEDTNYYERQLRFEFIVKVLIFIFIVLVILGAISNFFTGGHQPLVNLDPCGGYALGWDNGC